MASQTFNFTGAHQSFTVPAGVTTVQLECYGAEGGSILETTHPSGKGGQGGYSRGNLAVTPGQVLTVVVGDRGQIINGTPTTTGYPNGGRSGNGSQGHGGGGGGSSDVRAGGSALTNRVIVAGGGGGGARSNYDSSYTNGGLGGGTTGTSGQGGAEPGTQTTGHVNDGYNSYPGWVQGDGMPGFEVPSVGSGGGGGGYWGGKSVAYYAAAGGSGYIGGVTSGVTQQGGRFGAGAVVITYDSPPDIPTLTAYPSGAIDNVAPTLGAVITDPDGGNGYAEFQVATDSGFTNLVAASTGNGSTVNSGSASTRKCSGLNPSTLYYWRARTVSGGKTSNYSTAKSFTTAAAVASVFNFTGAEQTFTVPTGVTSVDVDLQGAAGGAAGTPGGLGGRVTSSITVTPGETLSVFVGGQGVLSTTSSAVDSNGGQGGFNGGGNSFSNGGGGGTGGGATDVRRGGTALANRVAVAAGGGGGYRGTAGSHINPAGYGGGAGGGTTGQQGNGSSSPSGYQGMGGTQSAGGAAGYGENSSGVAGSLGQGGRSGSAGGGGGGGYYGGGGGGDGSVNGDGGGGGGSSLVPAGGSTTQGTRAGNGVATLSYVKTSETANTAPTAPTVSAPVDNVKQRGAVTMAWTHNDANGDPQGAYAVQRTKAGVTQWWDGAAWVSGETYVSGSTTGVSFPGAAWSSGTYTYRVSTKDVFGAASPYSTARTLTILSGLAMLI